MSARTAHLAEDLRILVVICVHTHDQILQCKTTEDMEVVRVLRQRIASVANLWGCS